MSHRDSTGGGWRELGSMMVSVRASRTVTVAALLLTSAVGVTTHVAIAQPLRFGAPAFTPVRELSIDDLDEKWSLSQVCAMAVDSRGTMYVWELSDRTIRAYNRDGKPMRVVAREGSGPGEVSQTGVMQMMRDTLFVVETVTNRVSSFVANSGTGNTIVVKPRTVKVSGILAKLSGAYLAGLNVALQGEHPYSLVAANSAGVVTATFATDVTSPKRLAYNLVPEHVRNGPIVGRLVTSQPFGDALKILPTADGNAVLRAEVSLSPVGGSTIVLTSFNIRGDTNWIHRTPVVTHAITDAEFLDVIDSLARPYNDSYMHMRVIGNRKMILDSVLRPANWPAFTSVIAGTDGSIWLKQAGPPSKPDRYWRFSSTGMYEANVQMPVGFRLLQTSKNVLWGVRKDADGLAIVERYRVN